MNSRRCIAGRKVHEYQFEYLSAVHRAYPNQPKFMFAQFLEGTTNRDPLLLLRPHLRSDDS